MKNLDPGTCDHAQNASPALFGRGVLIIWCLFGFAVRSPAPVLCDGPPATITLAITNPVLNVVGTNTATLSFSLNSVVGNDTRLGLGYSGNVQNGVDVQPLPAFVNISAGQSSVALIVTPKANYPFSSKTLTVTLTNTDNVCVVIGTPKSATITLNGFVTPRLNATLVDSTNILLSCSTAVAGYVLQSSSNLAAGNWLNVTNVATLVQGTNRVTLVNNGPAAFFRLMKP